MAETNPRIPLFEHNGIQVILVDFEFTFEGAERKYASAAEAREAITAMHKRIANANKRKLDIAVIGSDGVGRTITGVHGRNGNLLLTGAKDTSYTLPQLYVALPDVVEKVKRMAVLHAEAKQLEREIWNARLEWADYRDGKCLDPLERVEHVVTAAIEKYNYVRR